MSLAGAPQKDTQLRQTPPSPSTKIVTGSDGSLCRGLPGAVWAYLSGIAAVARATIKLRRPLRGAIPLRASAKRPNLNRSDWLKKAKGRLKSQA